MQCADWDRQHEPGTDLTMGVQESDAQGMQEVSGFLGSACAYNRVMH